MKDEQEEAEAIVIALEVDPREAALIDIQVATAHKYGRNITKATNNAIAIVQMNDETAHSCKYTVPRGQKRISGPSVHMAKILAQNWGNLRIEAKVTSVDEKTVKSAGVCWDLESNVAIKMEVTRSILDKNGRRYSDDMVVVTGNAANAIAMRNAILNTIPKAVVDEVYKAAQRKIVGDISTADKFNLRRKQAVDKLKDTFNVTEAEILAAIGRQAIDQITADDIADLAGIWNAVTDGDTTVDAAFRGKNTKDAENELTVDELVKLFNEKKAKLDPKMVADATRILGLEGTEPEPNSFKKLHKELLKIK